MNELNPCPFCGSDDVVVIHDCHVGEGEEYASVTCRGCGVFAMALGHGSTQDEVMEDAKEKWNRRANECDREELLEIADYIAESDVDGVIDWPRRIREACGVKDGKDDANLQ